MSTKSPSSKGIIPVLILVTCSLIIAGVWFYYDQGRAVRKEVEADLAVIADLKRDQIVNWRAERLGDAAAIQGYRLLAEAVDRWAAEPGKVNQDVDDWMRGAKQSYRYHNILIVNPAGRVMFGLEKPLEALSDDALQSLAAAFKEKRPVMTELHGGPGRLPVHLDVIAPLFLEDEKGPRPVGAVIFQSDAQRFLYPLINSWPRVSRSAETLLVRRDGDSVLYLNELRHQRDTALSLRIPLSREDLPAVRAVLGKTGIFDGPDYRGVAVLAYLEAIPGSTWYMVAKVDKSEALAVWRMRSGLILSLLLGLIITAAALAGMIRLREQKAYYSALYEAEAALGRGEERYRTTLLSVGDAVMTADRNGRVELMNPAAESLTGWKNEDALGQPLDEVFRIINEETRLPVASPVARVLREGAVVGLANHTVLIGRDGLERPIADSGAPVRDPSGRIIGVVLVFQDQAAARASQKALHESEERFRRLAENAQDLIYWYSLAPERRFEYVSPAATAMTGYTPEEHYADPDLGMKLVHPEDRHLLTALLQDKAKGDGPIALRWIRKDGRVIWTEQRNVFIRDSEGKTIAIEGIARDITERHQAEEGLKRRMEELASLSRASQAITASLDMDKVLNEIVTLAGGVAGSDSSSIVLVDAEGRIQSRGAESRPGAPSLDFRVREEGFTRWIVHSHRAAVVEDIGEDGGLRSRSEEGFPAAVNPVLLSLGIRSFVGLPLIFREHLLGVLYLHSLRPSTFSKQLPLLTAFANQAAVAIENAHLYNSVQNQLAELKRTEEKLALSEERFRTIFEFAPDGIYLMDLQGNFLDGNRTAEDLTGFGRAELIGRNFLELGLLPAEHTSLAVKLLERIGQGEPTGPDEFILKRRDGSQITVEIRTFPVRVGEELVALGIARDISRRKRDEEALRAVLNEREAMLREIHHRVKNNIQVISSLLRLQSRQVKDEGAREILNESQNRIRSMALIHEKLYQSQDFSQVEFADYIEKMIVHLFAIYKIDQARIGFRVEAGDVRLDINRAIPCGLIINELVTNVLKHAFPQDRAGELLVSLRRAGDDQFELMVKDNGVGLPPGFDPGQAKTLGLQIVRDLTRQLAGFLSVSGDDGTEIRLRF